MDKYKSSYIFYMAAAMLIMAGCVERNLTVYTKPEGALVTLNEEQIGYSPVTVSFNWYGDYNIRITKQGYDTLKTHRELKRPWYDVFPFDFFVQVLYPGMIVDSYEWTFELESAQHVSRDKLIEEARKFHRQEEQK